MRKTHSPLLGAIRETAEGLHKAGVMDQITWQTFSALNLPPVAPLAPQKIKQIRTGLKVSQTVFAALLNTSVSTVQKWEIGQKHPTGAALKLLHLVQERGIGLLT